MFGTERGLFLTIWHLFTKPQQVTSAFITGDSLRYYSPIKYFIVMFALSIFISSSSAFLDGSIAMFITNKGLASKEVAQAFVADWNALLYLPLVLILALATRGFFREAGLNYAEHLVVAAYGWSQMVLLGAVIYLVVKFFKWVGLPGAWLAIFLADAADVLVLVLPCRLFAKKYGWLVASLCNGTCCVGVLHVFAECSGSDNKNVIANQMNPMHGSFPKGNA